VSIRHDVKAANFTAGKTSTEPKSELTVKTHLQNIRAKLGVKTRAQIVASLWRWLGCLALPQMLELAECSVWRIYPGIVMPISSGLL
jgi:hypothetical protein